MTLRLLDVIVLGRDLPDVRLKRGDLGTIVEIYKPGVFDIEFQTMDGRALAVVTLTDGDVRQAADDEILSVRRAAPGCPGADASASPR